MQLIVLRKSLHLVLWLSIPSIIKFWKRAELFDNEILLERIFSVMWCCDQYQGETGLTSECASVIPLRESADGPLSSGKHIYTTSSFLIS